MPSRTLGARKKLHVRNFLRVFLADVRRFALSQQVVDFRVHDFVVARHKLLHQHLGLAAPGADEDARAGPDPAKWPGSLLSTLLLYRSFQSVMYPCSFARIILASTTTAPSPSCPALSGLMSISSISGKSITSCESLCMLSTMASMSTGFSPRTPLSSLIGLYGFDHRPAFLGGHRREAERDVLEHLHENPAQAEHEHGTELRVASSCRGSLPCRPWPFFRAACRGCRRRASCA